MVHFRERNVECKFCGKRFQSNLGLQNHVGIHVCLFLCNKDDFLFKILFVTDIGKEI